MNTFWGIMAIGSLFFAWIQYLRRRDIETWLAHWEREEQGDSTRANCRTAFWWLARQGQDANHNRPLVLNGELYIPYQVNIGNHLLSRQ